jgi:uncharacterized protein YbjT (DUF2867 family)
MKMILLGLALTFQYERFYSWAQAEKIIEESGIPVTFIRPNFFMQNFVNFYLGKNQNSIYLPEGEGKVSFVAVRDIAVVAVQALTGKVCRGSDVEQVLVYPI